MHNPTGTMQEHEPAPRAGAAESGVAPDVVGPAEFVESAAHRKHAVRPRPPVRAWLQPAVIALIVATAFIGCYVGFQRNPEPHQIPVAVTGVNLPVRVTEALGEGVEVHPVADITTARDMVKQRDVVAALTTAGKGKLRLEVAGADGASTVAAVKGLVGAYAHGADKEVVVQDVVPLARYDARGLSGFYMAFGVTLAGFVLASNVLGLAPLLRLRHRFWLMAGASVAIGAVAAVIAGPVMGAVPAPLFPLIVTLSLLAGAASFTTKLLGTYFGPVGIPLATLTLLTVGNSTSGAAIGADLLPSVARTISPLLPPGAAVRAITNLSYFDGAHATGPVVTLALWAVIAGFLVWIRPRVALRRPEADI